jgi:hypothetical protein
MKKETRNLSIFLVATFIWTWSCYTPIAVSGNSPYQMPWMILLILGGMGPSLVGVVMVLLSKDKEQRRDYWRRCFSFRQVSLHHPQNEMVAEADSEIIKTTRRMQ